MTGEFVGHLVTRLILTDDARAAETVQPFGYIASHGVTVDVPVGTRTDLATLPFFVRIFATKLDRAAWAAVIHDILIDQRSMPRREADFIFYEAMRTAGVSRTKSFVYWAGVRFWGLIQSRKTRPHDGAVMGLLSEARGGVIVDYTIKDDRLCVDGTSVDFVPAANQGGRITPTLAVVHDTAGRLTRGSSVNWFKRRISRASAHFVIEIDGTITQMVECDRKAWHAGKSNYKGRKNCNAFSIGIEIVNPGRLERKGGKNPVAWFGQEFPEAEYDVADVTTKEHGRGAWMAYTPEQLAAVEGILTALKEAYPIMDVAAHYEISPRRKIDVNPRFPLEEMRGKARRSSKFFMEIGDEGDKVFKVQQRLVKLGYGATVKKPDGFFGPNTKRGILLWEDENGIERDGALSEEEFNILTEKPSKPMATGEATDQKKDQTKKEAVGTAVAVPAAVAAANYFGVDPNSLWEGLLSTLTRAGEVVSKVSGAGLPVTPDIAKWAIAGALGLVLMRWFNRMRG